jgi:preprotein translocase subunit SecB
VSPEDFKKQLSKISLNQIFQNSSNTFVDHTRVDEFLSPDFEPNFKLDNKIDSQNDDGACKIISQWSLTVTDQKKKEFLKIESEYVVSLHSQEKLSQEFWDIYKQTSLPLIVYPYFREFVQTTTSRMNIPPLTLPILFK